MRSLKFSENESVDNIETVKGLDECLKEWIDTVESPISGYIDNVENFEFKRRDGFIPFSNNRGGVDRFVCTDLASLHGSGEHYGLTIEYRVEKEWAENEKQVLESDSTLTGDDLSQAIYEASSCEYHGYAWRIRAMYEGDGVLCIHAGYDHDAPYFRWSNKSDFEHEIKFKTIAGLKRQLYALNKKIESSARSK